MAVVLLVDDHPLYHEGLSSALRRLTVDLRILGALSVAQGQELLRSHPEIELALIDLKMPEADGWTAMSLYAEEFPHVPRVLISGFEDDALVLKARSLGAAGYLPKSLALHDMVQALRNVLSGGVHFRLSGSTLARERPRAAWLAQDADPDPERLTLRQVEVLQLLCKGSSNKQIARQLQIADRTVRAHITDIFRQLGVSSRTQAVLAAMRLGLVLEEESTRD